MAKGKTHAPAILANTATLEATIAVNAFIKFCDVEILPSLSEIEGTKVSRVRLQKLVYAHVVDHFDQLLDTLLLWSSTHVASARQNILSLLNTEPITRQRVYELFLLDDARASVEEDIRETMKNEHVRKNHVGKINKLAEYFGWKDVGVQHRVNNEGKLATGKLASSSIPKNTPSSVAGFAHFLFARRNGINHGDSIAFLKGDKDELERIYSVTLPSSFKIKAASIETTVTFYKGFLDKLVTHITKTVQ